MRFGMGYGAWTDGPRGGRGRGHFGEDGHGRGRRKIFDGSELKLVLLKLIAEQPRHGYDLIRAVEERSGGAYAPSPGVVYPTLTLLDDMGLIEAQQSEGAKKLFAITDAGAAHLAENEDTTEALFARLEAIGAQRARTESGSIRRAMINLKQVLINRVGDCVADEEVVNQIVAIIDDAAQRIERLK
jgi:DNA-binding PadR family transcriptional regulator